MFKTVIKKDRYTEIDLEYDNEKYDIEYVKNKNMIILRRLKDNKVLEIFKDEIGFIVQCDKFRQTHFLVTDYSEYCNGNSLDIKFKHYIDNGIEDMLSLKKEFNCGSAHLSDCRITNSSYLIEQVGNGGVLYNLKQKSEKFEEIYQDDKISEMLDENILLVSEKKDSYFNKIQDTLTYGINPETLEIQTLIWSELQQRYISIYTKEQVDNLKEELRKKFQYLDTENYTLEQITIRFEVEKYLDALENYLSTPKRVYLDSPVSQINEDFVRKFVKK